MSALLAEASEFRTRRWTVAEYQEMEEKGVLDPEERTELIRGEIVMLPPIGPWHSSAVGRSNKTLVELIGDEAIIWPQNPVQLGSHSAPEPDFTILKIRDDFYADALPRPEDVLLMIEISDSSYLYDKNVKAPLYADFGIPELWLVHRQRSEVTRFSDPGPEGYRSEKTYTATDSLEIPSLDIPVPLSTFGI